MAWHTSPIAGGVADLGAHRLERQRHVRAGVAVGDRVHVEPVELLLVAAERVAVGGDDPGQRGAVDRGAGRASSRDRSGPSVTNRRPVATGIAPERPLLRCVPRPASESARERFVRWRPSARCAARSRSSACASATRTGARSGAGTPNVQKVRAIVNGTPKRLHVCTSCLKAGKVRSPERRLRPMQGVVRTYDPQTGEGIVVARHRPQRATCSRPDALDGLAVPDAAPGPAGELRPRRRGRPPGCASASEPDMGLPTAKV